jgi:hypothetical protein
LVIAIRDDGDLTRDLEHTRNVHLPLDVETRWNSTYLMLKYILDHEVPILDSLRVHRKVELWFRGAEHETAEALVKLLEPFSEATHILGNSSQVAMSYVCMCYVGITSKLREVQTDSITIANLKSMLRTSVEAQLRSAIDDFPQFKMAAYLDPRFRNKLCAQPWVSRSALHELVIRVETPESQPDFDSLQSAVQATAVPIKRPVSSLFDDSDDESDPQCDRSPQRLNLKQQLELYDSFSQVNRLSCPLLWWKAHRENLPDLTLIAIRLLAMSPTETASERAFSAAGLLYSDLRTSMSPKTLEETFFLYGNRRLLEELDSDALAEVVEDAADDLVSS